MARALVIGASGLVGGALMTEGERRGHGMTGTYARHPLPGLLPLDATRPEAVGDLLTSTRPDWVLMPAALPNVDLCETHPEQTRPANVDAVRNVAGICAAADLPLVFFSSDYVFDGAAGPYGEEDPTRPICAYGRQKLEAEEIVLSTLPARGLVLRTTGVFGQEAQGKNFVYRLVRTLREGGSLRVPEDQWGNPTLADQLAAASFALLERESGGVYHAAGDTWMNRADFARAVAVAFGLSGQGILPVSTAELGQTAPRPLRAGMRSDKLAAEVGPVFTDVAQALARFREQVQGGHDL